MRLMTDQYDFVDVQMTKINALVLLFFHITMHEPEQMKKSQEACIDFCHLH